MAQFGGWLTDHLDCPVTDETELKGKYDLVLTYATPLVAGQGPGASRPADGAANISEADFHAGLIGAMPQLRLKLEQKKAMIDMLVIDRLEKVPTEN
jgi:uncharacterized protein (TIGR03435 family)